MAARHPAFGPYRLIRQLGEGGMGQVWEAEHRDTSRIVALKIAHSALSRDEDREQFLREARMAASISHRNCVFVFGAVESEGSRAIVMELVRGGTAKDLVQDGKPLDPREAVRIALEMIDGLEAAYAKGILHRDIKPANIFIDAGSGAAKVGDFGLSTSVVSTAARSPEVSTTASFAGTPAYASPEQLQGRDLDVRSDIYSVGATLYYLLAGRPPFIERDLITLVASIAGRNPDPPSKFCPAVPREIDAVVLKCLAKNPPDRYEDYASLRNALLSDLPAPPGRRFLAGLIDSICSEVPGWPISHFLWAGVDHSPDRQLILMLSQAFVFLAIGAMEGAKGWSPGKLCLGLRVSDKQGPPGVRTGLLRSTVFFLIQLLPYAAVLSVIGFTGGWKTPSAGGSLWPEAVAAVFAFAPFIVARRNNGWSGLHDRWTSTRVILKRWNAKRPILSVEDSTAPSILQPGQFVGPFQIFGLTREWQGSILHQGWDSELRRRVFVVVHPRGTPELPLWRREAQRRGCLRWITGQRDGEECWDAYEMPEGAPLSEFSRDSEHAAILPSAVGDLCEELAHNRENDLDLRRVWISRNARGVLCDFPVSADAEPAIVQRNRFLDEVTRSLWAGNPPPLAVGSLLDRLNTSADYENASAGLRALNVEPLRRSRRLAQLLLANFLLFLFVSWTAPALWIATRLQNPQELPAALARMSETRDPSEKALLARYLRARFLPMDSGALRDILERSLRAVGMTDAEARLAEVAQATPATLEEIATIQPVVQKLTAGSDYSKIRIAVAIKRDVLGPLWVAVALQFLVGLLASITTGAPISFWLAGLAFTNDQGVTPSRWRVVARCVVPLSLIAGGMLLTPYLPLAIAVVPFTLTGTLALTIWKYQRGPFEWLAGLWISRR